jgi:hypothetical protein
MQKEALKEFEAMIGRAGERTKAIVMAELTHDGQIHFTHNGSVVDVIGLIAFVNHLAGSQLRTTPRRAIPGLPAEAALVSDVAVDPASPPADPAAPSGA